MDTYIMIAMSQHVAEAIDLAFRIFLFVQRFYFQTLSAI